MACSSATNMYGLQFQEGLVCFFSWMASFELLLLCELHDCVNQHAKIVSTRIEFRIVLLSIKIATNGRVFAKGGNLLIVQPGTNAHLRICC